MKKNKYGNIEDLVLDVNVVTPTGRLERKGLAPRESIGCDAKRTVLGSEGRLGIIARKRWSSSSHCPKPSTTDRSSFRILRPGSPSCMR